MVSFVRGVLHCLLKLTFPALYSLLCLLLVDLIFHLDLLLNFTLKHMLYHFLELFHDFIQLWKNMVRVQTKVRFKIFNFLILEADAD